MKDYNENEILSTSVSMSCGIFIGANKRNDVKKKNINQKIWKVQSKL